MKPTFAPTIYHDGQNLFLELPGGAQTLRFPFTEGGLMKALRFVPNITKQPGYVSGRSNLPKIAKDGKSASSRSAEAKVKVAKATESARKKSTQSEGLRNAAAAAIRKLKVGD